MKKCLKCDSAKTWTGDDIKCPFQDSEEFGNNWNCGLIIKIRQLCNIVVEDTHLNMSHQLIEEQHYVFIKIDGVIEILGEVLMVSWYKNRGRTDAMWLLSDVDDPVKPTQTDLEKILKYYDAELKKEGQT
jgi:hypothetical protein